MATAQTSSIAATARGGIVGITTVCRSLFRMAVRSIVKTIDYQKVEGLRAEALSEMIKESFKLMN